MNINKKNIVSSLSKILFLILLLSFLISSCKNQYDNSFTASLASSFYMGAYLTFDTVDHECVVSKVLQEPLKNDDGYVCSDNGSETRLSSVKGILEGMSVVFYSISDGSEGAVNEKCEPITNISENKKVLLRFSDHRENHNKNINYECIWQL